MVLRSAETDGAGEGGMEATHNNRRRWKRRKKWYGGGDGGRCSAGEGQHTSKQARTKGWIAGGGYLLACLLTCENLLTGLQIFTVAWDWVSACVCMCVCVE